MIKRLLNTSVVAPALFMSSVALASTGGVKPNEELCASGFKEHCQTDVQENEGINWQKAGDNGELTNATSIADSKQDSGKKEKKEKVNSGSLGYTYSIIDHSNPEHRVDPPKHNWPSLDNEGKKKGHDLKISEYIVGAEEKEDSVDSISSRDNIFQIDYNFDGKLDTLRVEGNNTKVSFGGLEKKVEHDNDLVRAVLFKTIDFNENQKGYDERGLLISLQAEEVIDYIVSTNDSSQETKLTNGKPFAFLADKLANHNVRSIYMANAFIKESGSNYKVVGDEGKAEVYVDSFGNKVGYLEIFFKAVFGSATSLVFGSDFRPTREMDEALQDSRGALTNSAIMTIDAGGKENLYDNTIRAYNDSRDLYDSQINATKLEEGNLRVF